MRLKTKLESRTAAGNILKRLQLRNWLKVKERSPGNANPREKNILRSFLRTRKDNGGYGLSRYNYLAGERCK